MKPRPSFPGPLSLYGTGLMGCSFALALRKQFPEVRIHGVDDPEVLDRARKLGAVEAEPDLPKSPTSSCWLRPLARSLNY